MINIVITGASAGIGFDTALQLAQNTSHRVLAIARQADKLVALQQLAVHHNLEILGFDVCSDDYNLVLAAAQKHGMEHIDILINNAGSLICKPFEEIADTEWLSLYEVNVLGTVRMVRNLLPQMGGNKSTHIVNIGSMGGFQGSSKFNGLSAYSASKAALANLTECLAEELKDRNISANCLCLGAVQTQMLEQAFPGYQAPINSESIAEYISWFALNGHRYQNGKIIPLSLSTP